MSVEDMLAFDEAGFLTHKVFRQLQGFLSSLKELIIADYLIKDHTDGISGNQFIRYEYSGGKSRMIKKTLQRLLDKGLARDLASDRECQIVKYDQSLFSIYRHGTPTRVAL